MAVVMQSESEVQRLVQENRTLVEWSVNRFLTGRRIVGAEREDLVSWGLMGLLNAARAFDPGRGLRFSTLATLSIERSIVRGASSHGYPASGMLSLDEALAGSDDGDMRWIEMLRDDTAERDLHRAEDVALVRQALASLRPEQQQLIHAHFFLGHSLADLSREWGVSRQAVAGQLRRALQSLRGALEPSRRDAC